MAVGVVGLEDVARTQLALVGGKGANLGELSRVEGIRVPPGFCVTTDVYRRVVTSAAIDGRLDRLARVDAHDRDGVRALCGEIRAAIEATALPGDVSAAIADAIARLGDDDAWAVRSSATAEDLPTASFAGQQDTFLDVVGATSVIDHVRRCMASLFTERAVLYRLRNGFDHRKVAMAVVVQRMVPADASGVLFTADPVSGNRKVACVEAVRGLGEALVSGQVTPDVFRVRNGAVVEKKLVGDVATLTDEQVVRLAALGRTIEAWFGRPQDIEWCLADDDLAVVQSRAITTLFPIPAAADGENHVYVSVGHQQMMTDAMKPLGISVWQLTAGRPMFEAGGRLFVDVTRGLATPSGRAAMLGLFGKGDPLLRDALETVLDRGFVPLVPDPPGAPVGGPLPPAAPLEPDPAIVDGLIARNEASVAVLERDIRAKTGEELLDFVLADVQEMRRLLQDPLSYRAVMAGIESTWWLNEELQAWLGEKNAADVLTQSVPNNVTSEMGLALLDVADAIRPHQDVVAFLEDADDDGFLDRLADVPGGREARDALQGWLDRYGIRCVGEIDVTRPRWSERPTALLPVLLSHVRSFAPGERERRFEQGLEEARKKEEDVLARLRTLPDGAEKASETKRRIDLVRTFIGYREYPKYGMIRRYFVYKQALADEARRLVAAGLLGDAEDAFFLTFQELHDVVRTRVVDPDLVRRRKDDFRSFQGLRPPRVLTSEGEALTGAWRREDVPKGALVGLAVSAGTVEGRARVVRDMADADVEPGDILVTVCTDPSWTPLFVSIAGLVTEVGGQMTHGAVIAREYGLPAVVGVEDATRRIRDGQRIRVHGTEGYVESLSAREVDQTVWSG